MKQDPETSWLSEVSSVVLQQSLRHLDTAFTKILQEGIGLSHVQVSPGQPVVFVHAKRLCFS
ncbi:hypothetical protein [Ferrovum myxofaciens]|uniref:hypothetical protein n=1 Tax=Ferrovum myxofaciens TaxID=416213 RepID=UPI002357C4DF|nr:hypothetical protein [Ferrovum myxofaciens]